ncbi:MAG: transpeptidase family protein [Treponema sp.]|nr:transpeptidase family protein [Treponema sp.]
MSQESYDQTERIASRSRFIIFAVIFSLTGLVVLFRYGYLMLSPQQAPRPGRQDTLIGRGPILDRNGRLLALETRLGNITLWRPGVSNPEELAMNLAPILEQSPEEILDRIVNSQSDFLYLRRQVSESVVRLIEAGIREGRLQGVGLEPMVGRIYPERNLAAQIIGFTGDEGRGLGGIEFAFEQELRAEAGTALGGRNRREGGQVFLTLDVNVQYILETLSSRIMADTQAEAVMFMALDPRTGDILGSASLPGYDPNNFRNSDELSRMDRPAIWAYEPGSVFKIFSLAALLDSGLISDDTIFYCNGHYERVTGRGERILISCLGAHGWVSARDIISLSCNAGAAYAADLMTQQHFYEKLLDFGFGRRTNAGMPGETAGFFRPPERWSDRSRPTISMGQEIAVSALQMLQAATAIANDGVLVPPRIVSRIVTHDGRSSSIYETEVQSRRVISPEAAQYMRSYMMDAASILGTGWRASVEDLSLGVKTGTAQLIDPLTGAYSSTDFISSTIAMLPAEAPTLILYLVIVKPRGEILAGRIAAPPIREAAEALINYLGIPRGRNPQVIHSGAVALPAIPFPLVDERVPDFTGLAKAQLLPLLLREDLNFHVSGEGWVVRQNPPPGTLLDEGTLIILELE